MTRQERKNERAKFQLKTISSPPNGTTSLVYEKKTVVQTERFQLIPLICADLNANLVFKKPRINAFRTL